MKNNKDYFELYSPLGDYAPVHSSEPIWKLALKEIAVYTLLAVGIVVLSKLLWSIVSYDYCPLYYGIKCF